MSKRSRKRPARKRGQERKNAAPDPLDAHRKFPILGPRPSPRRICRAFLKVRAIGLDAATTGLLDTVSDELGGDFFMYDDRFDLRTDRVDTDYGPVYVLRDASRWTAEAAEAVVLAWRGSPP